MWLPLKITRNYILEIAFATQSCAKSTIKRLKNLTAYVIINTVNLRRENMSFSENLYYLRKREGVSQEELAEELGVSRQAVSKWETGDAYPETEKIIMLCDRYGVTMDALMRGDVKEQGADKAAEDQDPDAAEPDRSVYFSVSVKKEDGDDDEEEGSTAQAIAQSVLWLCAVAVYIIIGVFGNLWHPGWILFVFMPAISAVVDLIAAPMAEKRGKIAGTLDLIAVFGAVGTYLLCGFYLGMWGSMWVVFFIIPIVCTLTGVLSSKNKKDKE